MGGLKPLPVHAERHPPLDVRLALGVEPDAIMLLEVVGVRQQIVQPAHKTSARTHDFAGVLELAHRRLQLPPQAGLTPLPLR